MAEASSKQISAECARATPLQRCKFIEIERDPSMSTGCTGLLLSLPRRLGWQQQQPPQPLPPPRRNAEAAERLRLLKERADWLRLRLLEEEFEKLSELLVDHEAEEETVPVLLRLEDGSYLREVSRRAGGRPWDRLAVQVSRPVVVHSDAGSASEVLDKMAAMGADNLCRQLNQKMPLKDIAGQDNPGEPVRRGDDDGDGLIVLEAMGKLESLVLEGLKIQATEPVAVGRRRERDEVVGNDGKGGSSRVHMVLVQARDPTERYAAVGDSMIGIIEASLDDPERKDATACMCRRDQTRVWQTHDVECISEAMQGTRRRRRRRRRLPVHLRSKSVSCLPNGREYTCFYQW